MKIFKIIIGSILPFMLIFMFIRLYNNLNPAISSHYVVQMISEWDPWSYIKDFTNELQIAFDNFIYVFENHNLIKILLGYVQYLFKCIYLILRLIIFGPVQELLEFFILILRVLNGLLIQPGITTPFDDGIII